MLIHTPRTLETGHPSGVEWGMDTMTMSMMTQYADQGGCATFSALLDTCRERIEAQPSFAFMQSSTLKSVDSLTSCEGTTRVCEMLEYLEAKAVLVTYKRKKVAADELLADDSDSSTIGNNNGSGAGKKSSESVAKLRMNVNMFLMRTRKAMWKLDAYPERYTSSNLSLSKSVFNWLL